MHFLADLPRPLTHYIVCVWRRRWLIVCLAWFLAVIAWGAITLIPDMYSSRAQVYLNTDTILRTFVDKSATSADFEKRVRVMRLQLLARENIVLLVNDIGLQSEIQSDAELDRVVAHFQKNIQVQNDEGQYFIISYSDQDPVLAQKVVDRIVRLFIEQDIGAGIVQSQEAQKRVANEIAKYEVRLAQMDADLAEFRGNHAQELASTEMLTRRLDLLDGEKSRVEDQLYRVLRQRDGIRELLARTPSHTPGKELDQMKLQLAQLQSQFNDNYPDIVSLKAKISELERAGTALPVNPEHTRLVTSLRTAESDIADLRQRQNRLRKELNELTLLSSQTPAVQAQLQDMMRSYEQVENAYNDLLAQQNRVSITASLSEGGGTIQYNIFEHPVIAAEPDSPKRGLLTLAALVMAFGAAGALAFVLAQLDRTYTQTADLEEALGLPVLGAVSPVLTSRFRRSKLMERMSLVSACGLLVVIGGVLFWHQEIRVIGKALEDVSAENRAWNLGDGS